MLLVVRIHFFNNNFSVQTIIRPIHHKKKTKQIYSESKRNVT